MYRLYLEFSPECSSHHGCQASSMFTAFTRQKRSSARTAGDVHFTQVLSHDHHFFRSPGCSILNKQLILLLKRNVFKDNNYYLKQQHMYCCPFPVLGSARVPSEAWKVSVLAIVILWSSWPADTLVRFQCGSAGDKWGFQRSLKSKSLPMPTARLCPPTLCQMMCGFLYSFIWVL